MCCQRQRAVAGDGVMRVVFGVVTDDADLTALLSTERPYSAAGYSSEACGQTDSTSGRHWLLFDLAFAAQALIGTASHTGAAAGPSSTVRSSQMCCCDSS